MGSKSVDCKQGGEEESYLGKGGERRGAAGEATEKGRGAITPNLSPLGGVFFPSSLLLV